MSWRRAIEEFEMVISIRICVLDTFRFNLLRLFFSSHMRNAFSSLTFFFFFVDVSFHLSFDSKINERCSLCHRWHRLSPHSKAFFGSFFSLRVECNQLLANEPQSTSINLIVDSVESEAREEKREELQRRLRWLSSKSSIHDSIN